MAHIELSNLSVEFGSFKAVNDVSLDISNGEFVVYLGPSGCGKTTTLRCIAGLEQPAEGEILFDGKCVNEQRPTERNVAMVFQSVSLYPHLKIKDNIAFPLRARRLAKNMIQEKLAWAAETFKLHDVMDRYPIGLPPGTKQKVALARAVVRDPNVLLLDEPLSAIDEQFREEMRWELRHLQKQLGFTTVYVTHDQREAMSLADRIILMREGRIVQIGSPRKLYMEPANDFAGFFIGSPAMNFIDVDLQQDRLLLGEEQIPVRFDEAIVAKLDTLRSGPIKIGIRPQHVSIAKGSGSVGGFRANIVERYHVGRDKFFNFMIDEVVYQGRDDADGAAGGEHLRVKLDPDNVHFFDRATGERLRF